MKAILLAAGYATRLRPLTDSTPKPLLPIAGRPMLEWVLDRVDEVDEVDAVHVVTNAKFAPVFEEWAHRQQRVRVHDDGTTTNETRLGAIGDIRFVVRDAALDDHLLVIAGDNLFEYSLAAYVAWWHAKGVASAVALHDVGDVELVKEYGVVSIDAQERITGFEEKPEHPPSTLAATATYLFHREHVPFFDRYLDEGNSPDQPGRFVEWLYPRGPVYGYRFDGSWLDIGNREQLLEADNEMRERRGLPTRADYSLQS